MKQILVIMAALVFLVGCGTTSGVDYDQHYSPFSPSVVKPNILFLPVELLERVGNLHDRPH